MLNVLFPPSFGSCFEIWGDYPVQLSKRALRQKRPHVFHSSAWTELHTFAVLLQQDIGRTHDYSCGPKYQSHRIHVIMVYLPTKLGDLCWADVGKYSSTMEHLGFMIGKGFDCTDPDEIKAWVRTCLTCSGCDEWNEHNEPLRLALKGNKDIYINGDLIITGFKVSITKLD